MIGRPRRGATGTLSEMSNRWDRSSDPSSAESSHNTRMVTVEIAKLNREIDNLQEQQLRNISSPDVEEWARQCENRPTIWRWVCAASGGAIEGSMDIGETTNLKKAFFPKDKRMNQISVEEERKDCNNEGEDDERNSFGQLRYLGEMRHEER